MPVGSGRRFVSVRTPIEEVLRCTLVEKPDLLVGYGGWVHLFFKTVAARGIEIHAPKMVMYVAEALPHGGREQIEGAFGIPVMSRYSAAEAFKIGFYCERRSGFHLHEDVTHVRVVGPRRTLGPDETGRLVISNLVNRGSVLLNYPVGDLGSISREQCSCGEHSGCSRSWRGASRTSCRCAMAGSSTRGRSGRSSRVIPTCSSISSPNASPTVSSWGSSRSIQRPLGVSSGGRSRCCGNCSARRRRSR